MLYIVLITLFTFCLLCSWCKGKIYNPCPQIFVYLSIDRKQTSWNHIELPTSDDFWVLKTEKSHCDSQCAKCKSQGRKVVIAEFFIVVTLDPGAYLNHCTSWMTIVGRHQSYSHFKWANWGLARAVSAGDKGQNHVCLTPNYLISLQLSFMNYKMRGTRI